MAKASRARDEINNDLYHSLGERWYTAQDDPVALLRAEAEFRNPWVLDSIAKTFGEASCKILDVACGGGFLSNALARAGHQVTGIDLSRESLAIARRFDMTGRVGYVFGNAYQLPYADRRFDVVCVMDFLEHVEEPEQVVAEAARVLRPGGLFFFYTFNRNPLAWLIVIKGVEWFVRNTPKNMHLYRLFLKPSELQTICRRHHLSVKELRGTRPDIFSSAFWKMLSTGRVPPDFRFTFTDSLGVSYLGLARKEQ